MTPPPQPGFVYVDETGQVSLNANEPNADQFAFDKWLATACSHGPSGELVSHRLGNLALINCLAELLSSRPDRFPILLGKVLCDSTHAGDFIDISELDALIREIHGIHDFNVSDESLQELVRNFEGQMLELVEAATAANKPIVFL